jgi:putative transposase
MEKYRIVEGIAAYFVTFTVVEWLPIFIDESACKVVTESLDFCITNKFLRVNAYVIMPTHMHAILFDSDFDTERLRHTLDDFRKFTGRQLADYCDKNLTQTFGETLRKNAGKDRQRRFWQSTKHPEGIFSEKFYTQKNKRTRSVG